MKRIGIISYNIFCNFTNYGSALQSFALNELIKQISFKKLNNQLMPVLVPYCPKVHENSNPISPFNNMWDKSQDDINNVISLSTAIKDNYKKFISFFDLRFQQTEEKKYTRFNFNKIEKEKLDGFVCGADTIFCTKEFGFDDGYFANFPYMKSKYVFSYAASFGDSTINEEFLSKLNAYLPNFKALGIREPELIEYIKSKVNVPVDRVLDPTLLLPKDEYLKIAQTSKETNLDSKSYLLLYSRRHNEKMEKFADELALKHNWKVVEISLRSENSKNHIQKYEAGVEEFLSLVTNAAFVVTNSYHGMIFATKFHVPFYVFSREQCDLKINDLLLTMGLRDRLLITGSEKDNDLEIDYAKFENNISPFIEESRNFLEKQLIDFYNYD
jgi:hypothetical protein